MPGIEKNLDIAYALRDLGWNCLYFHYRGCWGSGGVYSFTGLLDDVRAATEWVVVQPSVDTKRLALVGSSMGGYVTLAAGAAEPHFRALVSICPLIDPAKAPLQPDMAEDFVTMLNGVSGEELKAQWDSLPSILGMRDLLQNKPVLLVTGDRDELFPPSYYTQLTNAFKWIQWKRFPNADHSFSACRKPLVQTVTRWLNAKSIGANRQ